MPIYEYECQKCGCFEVTQKITEKPLGKCPTCKSKVKKLISNTSFQLKGTGWYITDYARKEKRAADGNGAKASGSESKADGKSDVAPTGGEKSSTTKTTKSEASSSTST